MGKFKDITGEKFERLLAVELVGKNSHKQYIWRCICDCGKEVNVTKLSLITGNTKSCGCYRQDVITKHGGWNKSSYNTWRAMIRRCTNIKDKDYPAYGARGIKVHPAWYDYKTFANAVGEPKGDQTLDRIDNTGNYVPNNVRWATILQQNRNQGLSPKSKTGYTGISIPYEGKYMAKIVAHNKSYYSKVFNTIEEAIEARKHMEVTYWDGR